MGKDNGPEKKAALMLAEQRQNLIRVAWEQTLTQVYAVDDEIAGEPDNTRRLAERFQNILNFAL